MVYCSKCGTQNPDDANNCTNCGAPLQTTSYGANPQDWQRPRHHHGHYHDQNYQRRNSGIGLLIGGIIVVVLGLMLLTGNFGLFITYFWPIVLVVIGIWLLIQGLMRSQRRYR
ncbi:MAG: zinc-ribbon domain-containing protein [Candidatus Bathyarchaeia archaeon]